MTSQLRLYSIPTPGRDSSSVRLLRLSSTRMYQSSATVLILLPPNLTRLATVVGSLFFDGLPGYAHARHTFGQRQKIRFWHAMRIILAPNALRAEHFILVIEWSEDTAISCTQIRFESCLRFPIVAGVRSIRLTAQYAKLDSRKSSQCQQLSVVQMKLQLFHVAPIFITLLQDADPALQYDECRFGLILISRAYLLCIWLLTAPD